MHPDRFDPMHRVCRDSIAFSVGNSQCSRSRNLASSGRMVSRYDCAVNTATRLLVRAASRDAVTLRSIAREAGIAAPSIYHHFADRDAVLDAVVSTTFEQLEAICARACDSAHTVIRPAATVARAARTPFLFDGVGGAHGGGRQRCDHR